MVVEKQINLLNETVLECLSVKNETVILKKFTDIGLKILNADFGIVWVKTSFSFKLKLGYKSSKLPFSPVQPRDGGRNHLAIKNLTPIFINDIAKISGADYMHKYVKSVVIIPIVYKKTVYGTVVFSFKKKELFSSKKRMLCIFIGNIIAQAITIHRVVSSQKRMRILKETERLLEEERMKVESIAEATHELRTPLAIMKGNVELILLKKRENRTVYEDKMVGNIDKEIDHLSSIISDLALLTSEGGQVRNRINHEVIDISQLLNDIVNRLKHINYRKNISFISKIEKGVLVTWDSVYLEKLFSILIRDAITYGKKDGFVRTELSRNKNFVEIRVIDDGLGIGPSDLPFIFNRFYRVDKSHNLNGKRTGLGLAIAKWVADVHGGSISVESTLGLGSTFCVSIPTKA